MNEDIEKVRGKVMFAFAFCNFAQVPHICMKSKSMDIFAEKSRNLLGQFTFNMREQEELLRAPAVTAFIAHDVADAVALLRDWAQKV